MENIFANDFDQSQDEPGYRWESIRLGRRLGGEMLGASVYVLPPGEKSFPYHLHHANEELLLVVEGDVVVRQRPEKSRLPPATPCCSAEVRRVPIRSSTGRMGRPAS